jgi:ribosomal protein S18 acetylase RimI-like enzyme
MEHASSDLITKTSLQLNSPSARELLNQWLAASRKDARSIGWLPTSAFYTRCAEDGVVVCYRNADLVGWAMTGVSQARLVMKVYQIWVRPDARIVEHGRALMDHVYTKAAAASCFQVEAWVAEDLEANMFWSAIGFMRLNWRWGRRTSTRRIFRWVTPVEAGKKRGEKIEPLHQLRIGKN